MPIVLIVIGLAVAVGVGSYFFRPEEVTTPVTTEIVEEAVTNNDSGAVPPATSDTTPSDGNVPTNTDDTPVVTTPATPTDTTDDTPASTYANGAHTVNTAYTAPGNARHTVEVTLTLTNDIVTGSKVTFGGDKVEASTNYQNKFMAAYQSQVIGKKLNAISLSRVGGASLTTGAFNDAVAKVKTAAKN